MAQMVKNLPAMQETHPLQDSHLENPMDRGVLWATVQEVAELDVNKCLTDTQVFDIVILKCSKKL